MRHWWSSRRVWMRGIALLAAVLVLLSGGATVLPNRKGLVTGGVVPCAGIIGPNEPRFAGATVTVLGGNIDWAKPGQPEFPAGVVARETVPTNGTFQFALDPGHYVLTAEFPPPANIVPFSTLTLRSGDDLRVDISNQCI